MLESLYICKALSMAPTLSCSERGTFWRSYGGVVCHCPGNFIEYPNGAIVKWSGLKELMLCLSCFCPLSKSRYVSLLSKYSFYHVWCLFLVLICPNWLSLEVGHHPFINDPDPSLIILSISSFSWEARLGDLDPFSLVIIIIWLLAIC